MNELDIPVSLKLEEKLVARIDRLADKKNRSRSGQVEYMLLEYMRRNEPPVG